MSLTLKAARINVGLNQEEAAKRLGISVASLQNYESGRQYPNVLIVKRMEDLYGVPYDNLNFLTKNHA